MRYCVGAILLLAILGINSCSQRQQIEDEREAKEQAAKNTEDRRKGFHCIDPFFGYSTALVDAVKARLRDPDSFEHDETSITPAGPDGAHTIIMSFRAKNGFGGVNRSVAVGKLSHESCAVVSVALSGQ